MQTHTYIDSMHKKATSFNTYISSKREAAWSHKSGSCVCVQTKWIAAGWNCATVWLRIGASMACGGTSGAKLGYRWHGSILTTTSVSKHWGMERDPGIRCASAVLLQQFLVRLTGRNHFHTVSWSFFFLIKITNLGFYLRIYCRACWERCASSYGSNLLRGERCEKPKKKTLKKMERPIEVQRHVVCAARIMTKAFPPVISLYL